MIALNPLKQMKQLLLTEVNKIIKKKTTNNENNSLEQLYFKIMPMDEILSDDIICSIIPYLSGSNMYNKLPCVNKHFQYIFKNYPVLFRNYIMRLPLYINKSLHCIISHKLNRIELYQDKSNIIKTDKEHCIYFEIHSINDLNKYCPFKWDEINKWHFVIGSVNKNTDNNNNNNQWQQIIHEIISQCIPFVTSLKIENISSETKLMNNKIIDLSLLSKFNLVKYINFPSNEFIELFLNYNNQSNEILRNILYLDLIRVNDNAIKILKQLKKLLVLKLQFDDDTLDDDNLAMISINGRPITPRIKLNENIIEFPSTIEFLIIDGFHFFQSDHVLNFKYLSNLIALTFTNSTFEQWMTNFSEDIDNDIIQNTINNHILWPINDNNIQCVFKIYG